ncbi:MAG: 6-carboxytetrahydropterin synthase [Bacteroidia bacterium]|nr:6-carboxytetrahydropterin synthase [Bacteroidia bacterium]
MVYLTRRETFNAAHRLYRPEWSAEQNDAAFGKCANPNWHGHNYILHVTVKGEIDPGTGYFINLKDLSQLIRTEVIEKLDHKNINLEVDFMKGKMASAEVLAVSIWEVLDAPVRNRGGLLHSVRIQETENNSVEYFGR